MVVWRNICEFGYTLFWKRYEGGCKGWKERVCTKHNLLLLRHGPIDSLPPTLALSLKWQLMDIHKISVDLGLESLGLGVVVRIVTPFTSMQCISI